MKPIILMALAALALPTFEANAEADLVERVFRHLQLDPAHANVDDVTAEIRPEILARVHAKTGKVFAQTDGFSRAYFLLLVRLGDEDSVRQVVEAAREGLVDQKDSRYWHYLSTYGPPAVIPFVAKDFYRDDGDKLTNIVGSDTVETRGPISFEMCRLALHIVAMNSDFPSDTRRWARVSLEAMEITSPPRARQVIQNWWEKSELLFRDQQYGLVRPGEHLAPARAAQTPPASKGK